MGARVVSYAANERQLVVDPLPRTTWARPEFIPFHSAFPSLPPSRLLVQLCHLAIGTEHRVRDGRSGGGGGQRRRAPTQPASLCGIWSAEWCAERLTQLPVLPALLLTLLLLQLLLQGRQLAFQLLPLGVRLRQLALQCVDKR